MRASEPDVVNTTDDSFDVDKMRLQFMWDMGCLSFRINQGRGLRFSVGIRSAPENQMLLQPGYMLRATNSRALKGIIQSGLHQMARNAIHFIPAEFAARQSLYIQRKKHPYSLWSTF